MEFIHTDKAPKAIGPYSQAVAIGDFLFTSGQLPMNPDDGKLITGKTGDQTHQVFKNLIEILKTAGCTLNNVVKVTIFLKDLQDFQEVNGIYSHYFQDHKPARSTVQVAKLPMDVSIEIEMIAVKSK